MSYNNCGTVASSGFFTAAVSVVSPERTKDSKLQRSNPPFHSSRECVIVWIIIGLSILCSPGCTHFLTLFPHSFHSEGVQNVSLVMKLLLQHFGFVLLFQLHLGNWKLLYNNIILLHCNVSCSSQSTTLQLSGSF